MTKKPSYRFTDYDEPWSEKKLGELADIVRGASPRPIQDSKWFDKESDVGWLRISDVTEQDGRIYKLEQRISKLGQAKTRVLFEPHLLLSIAATVGKPVVNYVKTGVHDGFLIFLAPRFDQEFLFQWLDMFRPQWQKYGQPGSQVNLNSDIVKNQAISLPFFPEQTAIGSLFQDIDQLISLQQRKLEVLKEQKKTYLKLLFPAKGQTKPALRFAGFEDEWKEVKLGEVFDIVTDYVANGSFESLRNNVKTYEKDNFAYMIRLQDASNSWKGPWLYTDEKGYNFLSKSRLFKDDILMSNVGTVGRFFQVPELDRPMTLAPNSVLIRSTSSNNQFLYFMMLTANIQDQITMRKTPGVQDKINKTDFKRVIATLPALPEQEAIASFFQDLDKAIAKQEEKVNQLKESKQTLLRKMFI